MNNGKICPKAKTKDRCFTHSDLVRFPTHEKNPENAEKMIRNFFSEPYGRWVDCPCGKKNIEYHLFPYHCSYPKHKAWVKTMSKPISMMDLSFEELKKNMRKSIF